MRLAWVVWVPLALADVPAPPGIAPGGIVNGASLMPATLPGGAISRGARFRIPGVRLGPDTAVRGAEGDPPARLAGVSVRISQGERSVDAGLLAVSAQRIDAWMPSTAPLGAVQLTVTFEERTSEPYALTVVAASPGFFTAETAPEPVAGRMRELAARPGGTIDLWTTGLSGVALEVFVGGKAAHVRAAGEDACCRGVERVAVVVPGDAPLGCAVPVQARTAEGVPTNSVPIAVHAGGQACHDPVDWFRGSVERATRAGFVVLARVRLDSGFTPHNQFDYGIASFARQESGLRAFPPLPPLGTCTTFTARINLRQVLGQARSPAQWTSIPEKAAGSRRLDAGASVGVAGPDGKRALERDARRQEYYAAVLGGSIPFSRAAPLPYFLNAGAYTVTGAGGADVGGFSVALRVPRMLVWKNRDAVREVDRRHGVIVEWKAARSDAAILILGANADRFSGDSAMCLCMARARDGRFAIPAMALGNFPATQEENELSASYLVLVEMPMEPPARIEASGVDAAFAAFVSANARVVRYR